MIELCSREKGQAPPPWAVWEALTDPFRQASRQWLAVREGEVVPRVLEAREPSLVVWSSLWPERPDDRIRFDITPKGDGSALRWTLLTPSDPPEEARVRELRHRLNELINGQLRESFDQ